MLYMELPYWITPGIYQAQEIFEAAQKFGIWEVAMEESITD